MITLIGILICLILGAIIDEWMLRTIFKPRQVSQEPPESTPFPLSENKNEALYNEELRKKPLFYSIASGDNIIAKSDNKEND